MQKYRVTVSHIVPPIVIALAKQPVVEKFDLSSLKLIMSGAAPLGAEIQEECAKRLKVVVKQGYGMSELSPVSHSNPNHVIIPGPHTAVNAPSREARPPGGRAQRCRGSRAACHLDPPPRPLPSRTHALQGRWATCWRTRRPRSSIP